MTCRSRVLLDYPHRSAGHCGSGALRDLLEWSRLGWGGPPSEGLVFGLGGGLAFDYLRIPGLIPPIYLVGRGGDLEVDLLHRVGAQVELAQTDDPEQGWAWVREELDAARPVMVWADIAELPYLRVRLQMTRHDIVLVGYDDNLQLAYVVDNDREDVQEVPYAALARARAATGFPVPTRHATFRVQWPSALPDLRAAAADAFAASAARMRNGSAMFEVGALPAGTVAGSGVSGVAVFADDVARWSDVLDEPSLEAAVRALPVFIDKAGTGGGLFRRLQVACLNDVAALTGDAATRSACGVLAECAAAWVELATATAGPESVRSRAESAAEVAARLPQLEVRAVEALETAAASLGQSTRAGWSGSVADAIRP